MSGNADMPVHIAKRLKQQGTADHNFKRATAVALSSRDRLARRFCHSAAPTDVEAFATSQGQELTLEMLLINQHRQSQQVIAMGVIEIFTIQDRAKPQRLIHHAALSDFNCFRRRPCLQHVSGEVLSILVHTVPILVCYRIALQPTYPKPLATFWFMISTTPSARSRQSTHDMRHGILLLLFLCSGWFGCYCQPAYGQADELDEYGAGLIATYVAGGKSVQRLELASAMLWPDGPPDTRLNSAQFTANLQGFLLVQARGAYRISVYAAGAVELKLDGKTIVQGESTRETWIESSPQDLAFGYHPLEVTYRRTSPQATLRLFWEGPQFQREPIPARQLYHDPAHAPASQFARGEVLVRSLRCHACHELSGNAQRFPAASLSHANGSLERSWLVQWLMAQPTPPAAPVASEDEDSLTPAREVSFRRMPHFSFNAEQAESIADYLLSGEPAPKNKQDQDAKKSESSNANSNKDKKAKPKTPEELRAAGEQLLVTTGCLACHQFRKLGQSGLFGGGDLSEIADKRPAAFFETWLSDPARINEDHQMPIFSLSGDERKQLSAYLASLKATVEDNREIVSSKSARPDDKSLQMGRELVTASRCAACHQIAGHSAPSQSVKGINIDANWQKACSQLASPTNSQPAYGLSKADQAAVVAYFTEMQGTLPQSESMHVAFEQHRCFACHLRDQHAGLAPSLTAVAKAYPDLVNQVPAMTPPPLTSVGDKLHDGAIAQSIMRSGEVHRPYLSVRMPKFRLTEVELKRLVEQFVSMDRVPEYQGDVTARYREADQPTVIQTEVERAEEALAGARLVTSDGFGCTSCHRVGSVDPPNAPLNARGPSLSELGKRIRPTWYDRWTRNPARIVPRMEMPSVQVPVQGVLGSHLDRQLVAVWKTLNRPGFEPPRPNPVRVVRRTGMLESQERAVVLTDVLKVREQTYIKPFLVGLPNRQNMLIDLETNRLAGWWLGDAARQHTQGKTWFWEAGGENIWPSKPVATELEVWNGTDWIAPGLRGQFVTEIDEFRHVEGLAGVPAKGISLSHRLDYDDIGELSVTQTWQPMWAASQLPGATNNQAKSAIRRTITIQGAPKRLRFALADASQVVAPPQAGDRQLRLKSTVPATLRWYQPAEASAVLDDGVYFIELTRSGDQPAVVIVDYETDLVPAPMVAATPSSGPPLQPIPLQVVPGYEAIQLPIAGQWMPTGLAWRADGSLVVTSLKGQVWIARDTNGDGLEDTSVEFSDELAAPYGVATQAAAIDVINKYALLRLLDEDGDGFAERTVRIASGWGHTADYHDWAVGLPRDESGAYFLAIPCQQDDRSPAAAKWRGVVMRLVPESTAADKQAEYRVEVISRGHRFPMGIARNHEGQLYVTDNQGNYNPFNELNHVLPGKHFGFINAIEKKQPVDTPPLTAPSIDIPHPWTRSVNGICFLETPAASKATVPVFGPFEGHLVGCEYDTRRLVRMSLEEVEGEMQGGIYPFTYDEPKSGPPLLGPIVCSVSPQGDLYIGSLRDSGWGGANNIGSLTRLRPLGNLPAGIREIKATSDGFKILFTAAIDRALAGDLAKYHVESYRRVSTPAYGGPDQDRRNEPVESVDVAEDGLSVRLKLTELRAGCLYEFRIDNLVNAAEEFFPAEGFYTLRKFPKP